MSLGVKRDPNVPIILNEYPEASWFEDSTGWTIYNGDTALGHARKLHRAWKNAAQLLAKRKGRAATRPQTPPHKNKKAPPG